MNQTGSLLEKKMVSTRRVHSEETLRNIGARLEARSRKPFVREYGFVTGFVMLCVLVKSIY